MANTKPLDEFQAGMSRLVFSMPTWIAVLACHLCQAAGTQELTSAVDGRAGQDDPVRRRSAVEAVGRWVVDHYSDKPSAADGILDVTKAPYSADPTGKRDSTRAIQQAMKDARDARLITFLPGGTYRVSDTITCSQGVVTPDHWPFGQSSAPATQTTAGESGFNYQSDYFPCALMGSRTGQRSKIILAPRSSGFADPRKPKPVIYFWARGEDEFTPGVMKAMIEGTALDPLKEWGPNDSLPAESYNQLIIDIDLVLGKGNPGAVGIDHQAAQGSAIEDVTIDARGAFAGIHKAPGSGGGIHGLTVVGGRYGLYLKNDPGVIWLGAQPVPVVSNVTLKEQTELSIMYTGRGPLTVVGGRIEGAGVEAQGPQDAPWDGAMNFVDTVFRTRKAACAIRSNHSVYLHNVYFEHPNTIACIEGQPQLKGEPQRWTHVVEYAAAATLQYPPGLGGALRQDPVYLDGHPTSERVQQMDSAAPPLDLQSRHAWLTPPALVGQHGVANVRAAPYGAKGDGKTDDAAAIQRAIDENEAVFLPKGEYRLSRPLMLKSHTRLFGISHVLSVLSPMWSRAFLNTEHPAPLIDTVDDPGASTELAFVELRVPVNDPAVYALRWRAGRHSVVRHIRTPVTAWEPNAPPTLSPMIRIEASGGGRWYDLYQDGWWFHGPDYRHLLVEGTREPLSFYMLNPEHARSDVQVEFHDARNISVYSLKAEGMYTVLWINGCRDIRIYGFGTGVTPRPQWPVFRIDHSDDFLLANVNPDLGGEPIDFEQLDLNTAFLWAGGVPSDPRKWFLITDSPIGSRTQVGLHGVEQVVLYKRGHPQAAP